MYPLCIGVQHNNYFIIVVCWTDANTWKKKNRTTNHARMFLTLLRKTRFPDDEKIAEWFECFSIIFPNEYSHEHCSVEIFVLITFLEMFVITRETTSVELKSSFIKCYVFIIFWKCYYDINVVLTLLVPLNRIIN